MQHPYLRDGPCVQVDEGAGLGVEGFVIIMRMFVFFYVLFLFSFHVCFIQSAHLGPSVVPFIVSIGFWASCGKNPIWILTRILYGAINGPLQGSYMVFTSKESAWRTSIVKNLLSGPQ